MKRITAILGVALALAILPVLPSFEVDAQSDLLVDASIAERADAVIDATVLDTLTVELDGLPHTVHKLNVDYSGLSWVSSQIYVAIPGGDRSDGATVLLSNSAPFLNEGAEVQLALDVRSDALESAVAAASGDASAMVFTVVGGEYGVMERATSSVAAFAAGGSYAFNNFARDNFEPPTKFRVNPANSGQSASATIAAVRAGFDRWEDDPGSLVDFTYGGTTSKSGLNWGDGYTGVSWQNPSSANSLGGSLAIAHLTISGNTHEFEIVMSRAYNWTAGATKWNAYDISSVMAHEVGHGIGLAHVGTTSEIMFTHVPGGTVKPLGNGDRAGVAALYPAPLTCAGQIVTVLIALGQAPTNGNDVILGTAGADIIDALKGDDVVCGGGGDDSIDGGPGADVLHGQGGNDRLLGRADGDKLYGGAGDDDLYGGDGDDDVQGGPGVDSLFGENGNDRLIGGDGVDRLEGGSGVDVMHGQNGNDVLVGGAADDWLYGSSGADVLHGQDGDDRLVAGEGDDQLYGGAGADALHGQGGNDQLFGGDDDDELYGGYGADVLHGEAGADRLSGDADSDVLHGQGGNDVLIGGNASDWLFGGDGVDVLHGQGGDDRLVAGDGADDLYGGDGADVLHGQAGPDRLIGGSQADVLHGGDASDVLYGEDGADELNGNDGADRLYGQTGNDLIRGGAGDDVVAGGDQFDNCDGGFGVDNKSTCEVEANFP